MIAYAAQIPQPISSRVLHLPSAVTSSRLQISAFGVQPQRRRKLETGRRQIWLGVDSYTSYILKSGTVSHSLLASNRQARNIFPHSRSPSFNLDRIRSTSTVVCRSN